PESTTTTAVDDPPPTSVPASPPSTTRQAVTKTAPKPKAAAAITTTTAPPPPPAPVNDSRSVRIRHALEQWMNGQTDASSAAVGVTIAGGDSPVWTVDAMR